MAIKIMLKHNKPTPVDKDILVGKYEDCSLLKKRFLIIDKNNRLLLQHIIPATYKNVYLHFNWWDVLITCILPPARSNYTIAKAFIWGNRWSTGYYHFTAEDLPKLIYAKKEGLPLYTWHSTKISGWQKQLMAIFNISSNTINQTTTVSEAFYIATNRLHSHTHNRNIIHPALVSTIQEALATYADNNKLPKLVQHKVSWISRKYTRDRHIVNEDEYINNLKQAGIDVDVVYPEKLTLAQQIEAVYNAACIIGPHGAGLTNIMFSLNASLIEIGPEKRINNSFISLAVSYNRQYTYIKAQSASKIFKNRSNLIIGAGAGIVDIVLKTIAGLNNK